MTIYLDLAPEIEAALRQIAARHGQEPAEYVKEILTSVVVGQIRAVPGPATVTAAAISAPAPQERTKTGADLIAELEAEGVLTGYGDPALDSPDLARALREQFSRRETA
jgi:plasmid stability protein